MKTKRLIQAAVMVLGVLGVAQAVKAATSNTINANICQSVYPPDTSLASGLYHNVNNISNSSSGFRYVNCPMHRTLAASNAAIGVVVVATDNGSPSQLWCNAATFDPWGNTVISVMRTIPAGSGPRTLNFGSLGTASWGYANVFCTMPASSSIQQIQYTEN